MNSYTEVKPSQTKTSVQIKVVSVVSVKKMTFDSNTPDFIGYNIRVATEESWETILDDVELLRCHFAQSSCHVGRLLWPGILITFFFYKNTCNYIQVETLVSTKEIQIPCFELNG